GDFVTACRRSSGDVHATAQGSWSAVDQTPAYHELHEQLVRTVALPSRAVVLDVGSGAGGVSSVVLERYPDARVCAIDPSEEMRVSIPAAVRSRIECLRATAETLDEHVPPGFADCVFLANCVHLFGDRQRAFAAAARALAPGGYLALSTTFFEGGRDPKSAYL